MGYIWKEGLVTGTRLLHPLSLIVWAAIREPDFCAALPRYNTYGRFKYIHSFQNLTCWLKVIFDSLSAWFLSIFPCLSNKSPLPIFVALGTNKIVCKKIRRRGMVFNQWIRRVLLKQVTFQLRSKGGWAWAVCVVLGCGRTEVDSWQRGAFVKPQRQQK